MLCLTILWKLISDSKSSFLLQQLLFCHISCGYCVRQSCGYCAKQAFLEEMKSCNKGDVRVRDSKDDGANMGPTWVLSAPGGPHVGPINLAIRGGHCYSFGVTGCIGDCSHESWLPIDSSVQNGGISSAMNWRFHSLALEIPVLHEAVLFRCQWLSARLQYLHCWLTGDTPTLHKVLHHILHNFVPM